MDKLPGVAKVIVDYKKSYVFIAFDPKRTSKDKILKTIIKPGYEARVDPKAKWPKKK